MKVRVSALGTLKQYLPEEKEFELTAEEGNLQEIITTFAGIPPDESRLCYVVNGRIRKASYLPQADDKIVVLKMAGAG